MTLMIWIVTGLVVGWLRYLLLPGRAGGMIPGLVLAAIGALIGGYIATYFMNGGIGTLHVASVAAALAGAVMMLLVVIKLRI